MSAARTWLDRGVAGLLAAATGGILILALCLLPMPATVAGAAEGTAPAPSADELVDRIRSLEGRVAGLGAASEPAELGQAVDDLGGMVSRARDLDLSRSEFAALVAAGRRLEEALTAARRAREDRAGEDEEALAALYRSEEWRRLDFAEVTLGYWLGWALLGEARRTGPGEERRRALKEAEGAFSRASLELALPRIAGLSLLGLGLVWYELGESERAERVLKRFASQIATDSSPELRATARYHLALLALESGEVDAGRAWAERIPEGALPSEAELQLARAEAAARLEATAGRSDVAPEELERVAGLLRELAAAGGSHARAAAALVLEHRRRLAGLDVGPAGDLIAAEDAFAEERYAEAHRAYARALSREEQLGGIDLSVARYKFAYALAQGSGARREALAQLERVIERDELRGVAVRKPAVRLYFSLAEAEAAERPGAAATARAQRAARLLLDVDPQSPEADRARYRLAKRAEGSGVEERIRMLEAVPEFSDVYPAARVELVRIRARRLERAGGGGGSATRRLARALLEDLERVRNLIAQGRLERDPARDEALAVLRASAAAHAGAAPERVLELAEEARRGFALDPDSERTLLRLRLRALAEARRLGRLSQELEDASDRDVRRSWASWYELARRLEERGPSSAAAALRVRLYERLGRLAPSEYRDALALSQVEALLAADRAPEAAEKARQLVERDPAWGDAQQTYAVALEAAGKHEAAAEAWAALASGVDEEGDVWLEARIGLARSRRAAGDREGACRVVRSIRERRPELGSDGDGRLASLSRGCAEVSSESVPREGEGPSGTSPP